MRPHAPGRTRVPASVDRSLGLVVAIASALALVLAVPAYAGPRAERAKPGATRLTAWSMPSSATAGQVVPTTVRVASPGKDRGRTVVLQRRAGAGWSVQATARTDARGRAVLRWRAPAAGTVDLRVTVKRTGPMRAATSPVRTLRVVAAGSPASPTSSAPAHPYLAETLTLVNQARATARSCGAQWFAATGPLGAEAHLARAADGWGRRMGTEGFFAHEYGGSSPDRRIEAAGYRWSAWGENIAAGYGTPQATVDAWLASEGHCRAIMNPTYTQLGVGYVVVPGSTYHDYWVLNFGRPR